MSKPSTTKKAPKTTKTKPSGIEWLNDIPEHWEVLPGRVLLQQNKSKNLLRTEPNILSLSYGNVVLKNKKNLTGLIPENFNTYQTIKPNYIIIRPTDLQNDHTSLRVGYVKHDGIITSAYLGLITNPGINSKYIYYYLHGLDLMKVFYGMGSGLRQNLDFRDFKYLPICKPPKAEQDKIVAFLDRKTAQIDALIEKKQRLLKLLDEQLAIKINNAVTKGIVNAQYGTLNPHLSTKSTPIYTTHTSPLKNSGIEWIGDIPEEWEIAQLRHLIDKIDQGVSPQTIEGICGENEWGVLKSGCCNGGEFSQEQHKKLPLNFKIDENNILHIGDLLVSRACGSRALVGATALVKQLNYNLILSDKNFRLKPKPCVNNGFLNYSMNSFHFRRQIDPRISGADGLPNNIASSKLKEISIPVANHEQQTMIVNSIAAMIDLKSKEQYKLKQQISSLKELRNTFISKAVKGGVL